MRGALLLATIFLCASVLPIASAHDPPPDATGIIFSLSGDGGDFSLIRQEPSSASQGSRLINSGGSIDLGTWTTDPLTSPLVIENTEALVVVYALPVGIVIGAGMHISVRVMVDGEEIQSGDSETIILNEPLWTNIPWTSEEFELLKSISPPQSKEQERHEYNGAMKQIPHLFFHCKIGILTAKRV